MPLLEDRATSRTTSKYTGMDHDTATKIVEKSEGLATPFVYGTPVGKNNKAWPFVIVGLCGMTVFSSYIFYQLPEYRLKVRYELYKTFGAELVGGTQWVGGHVEVVDFVFLFLAIGLPTFLGGLTLALGNGLPPVPQGIHRTISRFLKRKIFMAGNIKITYAEMIAMIFFLGLNGLWFSSVLSRKLIKLGDKYDVNALFLAIGFTFGFNAVLCFSLLILPAIRNCFWMISIGVDYSHSIKWHRWIGFFTIAMVFGHAIPYYKEWISKGQFLERSIPCFNSCKDASEHRDTLQNFAGHIALLCCIIMGITSLNPIRRRFYELFYYSHHLFLVILVMMCLHYSSFIMWMYPAICLYMIHRILANNQSRVPCEIVDLEAVPGEITRIVFRRCPGPSGHYHAGQFVYVRIPMLSLTQWHPFSISSSPIEYEDTFTIHVKAIGKWTKNLYALAIQAREEKHLPLIYVDGFYGKMSDDFQHYPVLVLIAGGIGATPIISILGKILDCMRNNDPNMLQTQLYFQWTSREIGIFHEFEPLLDAIEEFDPFHERFKVRLCFTGDQHLGRVDIPHGVTLKALEDTSHIPTRPFFQTSRSIPRQMALFVVVFACSFAAVYFMRLGYPLLGENRLHQFNWPLQRLMEMFVVLAGAAMGWIVAISETKPRSMSRLDKVKLAPNLESSERNSSYSHTLSFDGEEIQFQHPVSRSRLNIPELMRDVVKEQSSNFAIKITGIGTWVSGPMGLIHAVETEAAKYAGIFDVHYEEFEI
jgi:predicted ferric reductase